MCAAGMSTKAAMATHANDDAAAGGWSANAD